MVLKIVQYRAQKMLVFVNVYSRYDKHHVYQAAEQIILTMCQQQRDGM